MRVWSGSGAFFFFAMGDDGSERTGYVGTEAAGI